jgi:hypothetical protein
MSVFPERRKPLARVYWYSPCDVTVTTVPVLGGCWFEDSKRCSDSGRVLLFTNLELKSSREVVAFEADHGGQESEQEMSVVMLTWKSIPRLIGGGAVA